MLKIRELSAVGVEVQGLDLAKSLDAEIGGALRTLLDEHELLLFRGQALGAEDHIRIVGMFGPVCSEKGDGVRHSFVSNVLPGGRFGDQQMLFHSDFAFKPYQPPVISLYGCEVEGASMPTAFISGVRAAQRLAPALRTRLEDGYAIQALHLVPAFEERIRLLDFPVDPPASTHPRMRRPILDRHPRTGATLLAIYELHTSHVEGLSSEESEALLEEVFATMYAPQNIYFHEWRMGDLLIWDNVATQHGRKLVGGAVRQARRTLRRVIASEKTSREILEMAA